MHQMTFWRGCAVAPIRPTRELLWRLRVMQPQITQVWADSAYAGQLVNWTTAFAT